MVFVVNNVSFPVTQWQDTYILAMNKFVSSWSPSKCPRASPHRAVYVSRSAVSAPGRQVRILLASPSVLSKSPRDDPFVVIKFVSEITSINVWLLVFFVGIETMDSMSLLWNNHSPIFSHPLWAKSFLRRCPFPLIFDMIDAKLWRHRPVPMKSAGYVAVPPSLWYCGGLVSFFL